jgi:hypothetical protein
MEPIVPRTSGNGILLELLVEFFYRSILRADATITRRKKFCRNGRVVAEVDVLLENGSERFAIECRDRSKPQGLPWIQQIIGKREMLRSFGITITQWFVLSASGFTEDAMELARTAGIELIVPGNVMPQNPDAPGLHDLMKFEARLATWDSAEITAKIGHSDNTILDQLKRDLAGDNAWFAVQIGRTPDVMCPFSEFVEDAAQPLIEAEEKASGDTDYSKTIQLTFKRLHGSVSNIAFEIDKLALGIIIHGTTVTPVHRLLTFASPITHRVLGIMGLNTVEHCGKRMHMMVHVKRGWPQQLTVSIKDDRGLPIPGVAIHFPASLVTPPNTTPRAS